MTKHLADHRSPSQGERSVQFLAIEKANHDKHWQALHQQPRLREETSPRLREFLRIERGERV